MRTDPCPLGFTIPLVLLGLSTLASAQQRYVSPLVHEPVDDRHRIVLKGNVHPLARPQFEAAGAPPDLPMERMLLVLKRSPEQETALLKLLDDQQDKSSPQFHKWLTPEQFGQQFGPADSDIQAVTSWLQGHGFEIAEVSKGRTVIEFSGSAEQVQETFHTAIRKYVVKGKAHWANAGNPEIPDALAPVVAGVRTLHNFYKQPLIRLSDEHFSIVRQPGASPQATSQSGAHALAPGDFAKIYNVNPLYQAGIDGAGTSIAVVGRSNIFFLDLVDFRNVFGLSSVIPITVLNGPDPGNLGGGEEAEALLDVSWSGAVARGAAVRFVISASTNATDGVDLSELYIVDNDFGDVMTESFSGCEAAVTSTEAAGIAALAQQAAAQGITYLVSSGDTGAAGCDNLSENVAQGPISVNVLAATPFNVSVGGTMFNENGHNSTYWNSANDSTLTSAKSYIPENVWNESCTTHCPSGASPLAAGGGGASTFFSKPSWQAGVSGIPADGARDLPDVSLSAAGHDPYLLCFEGSCESGFFAAIFGTSASAPSFAGIMALVNQKTGSRQGQANYVLYRLAATETLSQCNGSKTTALPASNCIFNDVTVGNIAVPGQVGYGTPGAKYQTTVGYDLATGLGSVNVANLVNGWSSVTFRPTTTTLTLTPQTLIHGASANVSISVAPGSGTGTPSGDVALITDLPSFPSLTQGVTAFTLNAGQVSNPFGGLPGGHYNVTAHYGGDATFAASDSAPVPVAVTAEGSTTTLSVLGFDASGNLIPFTSQPYGNPAYLRADISGLSGHGVASGNVIFLDNGGIIGGTAYALNSEGTAATAQGVFTLPPGQGSLVAIYGGDAGFNGSTSAPVNITVTKAPTTTTIASNSSSVAQGTPVALTATVNTSSAGFGPGGQVTFLLGGTPISPGSPVPVSGFNGSGNVQSGIIVPAQGTAGSDITLPVGQNSITAQYSGDSSYMGSSSTATIVNVLPDFALVAEAPSVTIANPGGSGTIMFTVTGQPGYNGSLNFLPKSCAGLPSESTCSFSPALVTGSGSTTLTISTTAAHTARLEGYGWWTTSFAAMLAGVFMLGGASRRRSCGRLLSLMAFALLITIAGCGGGSNSGGGGGGTRDPGTPVGTSAVTVTVNSGSITHSATFTLTVR